MLARIIENIVNPLIYLLIGVAVVVFLWGLVEFIAKADGREYSIKAEEGGYKISPAEILAGEAGIR